MSQTNKDAQKVAPETHSREANLKLANQAHGLQCAVEVAFGLTEVLDEGLSRFGTVAHPEAVKDVLRQLIEAREQAADTVAALDGLIKRTAEKQPVTA
jgi:hypothetical protein